MPKRDLRSGQLSLTMLFFAVLALVLITGFVLLASSFLTLSVRHLNRNQAFAIAESGIEYYRWHLAHAPQDYQDGTGSAGPYVHAYYDKNGMRIGEFDLEITAPPIGSTVVGIRSTGRVDADSTVTKIIEVKLAVPSFAKYAMASNEDVRFGEGTEVFGEIYSNGGIRFDGLAHNLVSSAQTRYDDPDHGGGNEFGVHTHYVTTDPFPPAAVPNRPDVFMAGRSFPVPALDFLGVTQDLAAIKTEAQTANRYYAYTNSYGYDLVFATSGIYTVYRVNSLVPRPNGCTNMSNQDGWGTWSIATESFFATGTVPAEGAIFFEDNVWVRGQVDHRRVTVGSGRFPTNPATYTNITVNEDLRYTNYDGSDVIALIAQNNFNVGLVSADVLRVDAALLAQNGRVGRYYYQPPTIHTQAGKCNPWAVRQKITLFGLLDSSDRYGFGYTDETGYLEREIIYDANMLYSPPPNFPLTTDQYVQISWDEVQ